MHGADTVVGVTGMRGVAALVAMVLLAPACQTGVEPERETRIRVAMADDWASTDAVVRTVHAFEAANPGVRVDVQGMPFSQIDEAVLASIGSELPYDLAQWHAFAAGALGLAEPIDDLWATVDADEFLPGAVADVVWGDTVYGVPLDVNAMVLLVNERHLEEAGVTREQLTTFAGLEDAARALTLPGRRHGMAQSLSTWSTYGWIRANGGEVVEVDDAGRPTFLLDDPRTVAAVEMLGRLVREGWAHPPGAVDRSTDTRELFNSGEAAMIATGSWDLVEAAQLATLAGVDAPRAVALPVPTGPDAVATGTALGGSSLFVVEGSEQRDLAFAFALALIEDEVALDLAESEGRLPVRRRVYDAPFFEDPTMAVVRELLEVASPMRLIAFDEAQLAFSHALERVLGRGEPAAEALAEAQRVAEQSVAG